MKSFCRVTAAAVLSSLLFASCAEPSDHEAAVHTVNPVEFTMLKVGKDSTQVDTLEPGQYSFSMAGEPDDANTARFSIYVSDEEYLNINAELKQDFVFTVGPDQKQETRLTSGNYVYIAATDNETGSWKEDLDGVLQITRE